MSGDIVDFIISKGNLYLLTDEFADYFSEPSHTTYEGNLYTVPLKDANDDWSRLKHLGTPGYFYGYQVKLSRYEKDVLMVWQYFDAPIWEIKEGGIITRGVDLRTRTPEKTLGYYKVPLDGSSHEKIRDLTKEEYPELEE